MPHRHLDLRSDRTRRELHFNPIKKQTKKLQVEPLPPKEKILRYGTFEQGKPARWELNCI